MVLVVLVVKSMLGAGLEDVHSFKMDPNWFVDVANVDEMFCVELELELGTSGVD